jgi:FKBP-type peptidyl-prolyl cis-trans isomerase SlyD
VVAAIGRHTAADWRNDKMLGVWLTSSRWFAGSLMMIALPAAAQDDAATAHIQDGSRVQLEYTLRDDAGAVLDTNKGRRPLTYTQGQNQIMPALEQALSGAKSGETKHVTLKPEEAYGTVDPTAEAEVPLAQVPAEARAVGSQLVARERSGAERPVRVKEIKEKTIVLDLNHPLAGKTLVFEVRVLQVEPPR